MQAGILALEDATFEAEGRTIAYRKASLTSYGEEVDEQTPIDFVLKAAFDGPLEDGRT